MLYGNFTPLLREVERIELEEEILITSEVNFWVFCNKIFDLKIWGKFWSRKIIVKKILV
jgi:hypothetical protein